MWPRTVKTTEWETLFYLRVAVSRGVGTAPFYVDTASADILQLRKMRPCDMKTVSKSNSTVLIRDRGVRAQ